jgi:hypothetical protein
MVMVVGLELELGSVSELDVITVSVTRLVSLGNVNIISEDCFSSLAADTEVLDVLYGNIEGSLTALLVSYTE